MTVATTFATFLNDQYARIFGRAWPVIPAALVIAALNVFFFAFDRPWTGLGWHAQLGDWLFQSIGLLNQPDLLPPLLYSGSLLNIGLLLGAAAAALLSREFSIRSAPAPELVKGALGGLMMGSGAVFSFGCNIGGFFSALSALSLSGVGMMLGLAIGAFAGTHYLLWETRRMGPVAFPSPCEAPPQAAPAGVAQFGA